MKLSHLMVSLFAENEESDLMVGIDIEKVVDVRSYKLEDEHDIIPFI